MGQSYTFSKKGGLMVYLAALKKGGIAPHIRTMSYIGSYPQQSFVSTPPTRRFFLPFQIVGENPAGFFFNFEVSLF